MSATHSPLKGMIEHLLRAFVLIEGLANARRLPSYRFFELQSQLDKLLTSRVNRDVIKVHITALHVLYLVIRIDGTPGHSRILCRT